MEPITTELRKLMTYTVDGFDLTRGVVDADRAEFERLCDQIDAVHESLERENDSLRIELARTIGELDEMHKTDGISNKTTTFMHSGMNITHELREYTEKQIKWLDMTKVHYRNLFAIADRIDAEHERQLEVLYRDMSDAEYVKLPKDADGEPIRFGDKVTVSWSEKVYEVRGFSYTERLASGERTIWVDVYSLEKMRNIPLCGANSCHHYHTPTVEDVMVEFATDWESAQNGEDKTVVLKEYAAKLRLAEGEDE